MSLSVVSSYPEKGTIHSSRIVGVASYTKNLLIAIKKQQPELSIAVFAEYFDHPQIYSEDNIEVHRSWRRGSLSSLMSLYPLLQKDKVILFSFEAYMVGNPIHTFVMLLSLLLLSWQGKKIVTILHQVVQDATRLEPNPLKALIINVGKSIVYSLILMFSSKIIVFEEYMKKILGSENSKIITIPHYIENMKPLNKQESRKRLGLLDGATYVLYFGFIAPYKGVDRLINAWDRDTKQKLIVAGGINPNHKNDVDLTNFVKRVNEGAQKKGVLTTGFVDERNIIDYFSAADILILPYTTFMSSSGPLALAASYELPIIISSELSPYFLSVDIHDAFTGEDLTVDQITYDFANNDLHTKIAQTIILTDKYKKAFQTLKKSRAIEVVANRVYNEICLS